MRKLGPNLDKRQLFEIFTLLWIGFGFLALILSFLGIFYGSILAGYLVLAGIFFAFPCVFNRKKTAITGESVFVFFLFLLP